MALGHVTSLHLCWLLGTRAAVYLTALRVLGISQPTKIISFNPHRSLYDRVLWTHFTDEEEIRGSERLSDLTKG